MYILYTICMQQLQIHTQKQHAEEGNVHTNMIREVPHWIVNRRVVAKSVIIAEMSFMLH